MFIDSTHQLLVEAYSQIYLEGAFEDVARIWKQASDQNIGVDDYIQRFKVLKDRGIIQFPETDISNWASYDFDDFQRFVNTHEQKISNKQSKRNIKKDAKPIFENDLVKVISPSSYDAACKYGAGTKWCIASRDTDDHWTSYTKNGEIFFFVISKVNETKYAVLVYPHAKSINPFIDEDSTDMGSELGIEGGTYLEVWNPKDVMVDITEAYKIFDDAKIPHNIFVNPSKVNGDEEDQKKIEEYHFLKADYSQGHAEWFDYRGAIKVVKSLLTRGKQQWTDLWTSYVDDNIHYWGEDGAYILISTSLITSEQAKEIEDYFLLGDDLGMELDMLRLSEGIDKIVDAVANNKLYKIENDITFTGPGEERKIPDFKSDEEMYLWYNENSG